MKKNNKNFYRFVVVCLLGLLVTNFSCLITDRKKEKNLISKEPLQINGPKTLLVFDSTDKYGLLCYNQVIQTFNYGKISYDRFDMATGFGLPMLDKYASIVSATENLWKLNKEQCLKLEKFISSGGGLAVLYRTWNENISHLFGVKGAVEPEFNEEEGQFTIIREFLPGSKGLEFRGEDISNYKLDVATGIDVIGNNEQNDIVWTHNYGAGKVLYWNTGLLARKINRGFITRSVGVVQPFTVVALANIGLIDIDDYPNSSSNMKLEPIKSEFDMTISEFYTLQWYPDMLKLAKRFGLEYTSVVVFNYNGQTAPPYKFYEWLHGEIKLGGRKIKSSQYAVTSLTDVTELGLHGYNHQPLTLENWITPDNMKLALNASKKRWEIDNLGQEPFSYIPPLNIYDSTGINTLTQVYPSIKEVGPLFLGIFEEGQFREFGTEPWNKDIYLIPRITSGFILTEFYKRAMISILSSNGIWSHFVHPDDVYPLGERYSKEDLEDSEIGELKWHGEPAQNGLYYHFINWLEFAKENYPWLNFMNRKQAYDVMQRYDQMKIGASAQGNILNLETNVVPAYFYLYLRDKNVLNGMLGCELVHEHQTDFGSHFVFKATDLIMMIQFDNQIKEKEIG